MTQVARFDPVGTQTLRSTALRWRSQAQQRWHEAPARVRTTIQMAVLLVVVGVAYNYSLSTLIQNAGLETPLAYVSLVPAIALALAAVRARPLRPEPAIHDRQVDYIVGLPLVGGALAANLLLPGKMSAMFWVWRIDLLTLPVFVAGAVAIIFGVRVLWRQKLAVGYLFLGWPYPYSTVLLKVLDAFTAATLVGIREIVKILPVAKSVTSPDGTLFVVVHHGVSFPLSVVSACSGVNSVVGFLLIGSAFAAVVHGPIVRKVLWLVGGMLLLWAINLGRITFIFWAGKTWGEHVAIDILHPFIGLVTFSVGVLFLVLLIQPLGMHVGSAPPTGSHSIRPPSGPTETKGSPAVPKVYAAVIVVTVIAIILGISNVGLKTYNLVADASGQPKLTAYIAAPVAPVGWRTRRIDVFNWAKPLFGDTSVWDRYLLTATEGGDLHTSVPVVADVIVTPELDTFAAYGVEACYQFHGYSLRDVAEVDIGGGITGQAMSYTSQTYGSWSIVYWIIPVKLGTQTTYERVVLYVQNNKSGVVVPATSKISGIKSVAGSLGPSDLPLIQNREFLVAFARELVQSEAGRSSAATPAASPALTATTPSTTTSTSPVVSPSVSLSSN
jgi:exosortase/archaeosortase family protein